MYRNPSPALRAASDWAGIVRSTRQLTLSMNTIDVSKRLPRSPVLDTGMVKVGGRDWSIDFTLNDEVPLVDVEEGLRRYLREAHGWFTGGAVTVNVGRRVLSPDQLRRMRDILEDEFKVKIARFWCRSEALEKAISEAVGVRVGVETRRRSPVSADDDLWLPEPPLMVKRACRSGTNICHNGDVVVMGDVNPGAQVLATGDIIVLGTLRGIAHAGANAIDPTEAVIIALALQPTQLRIGPHLSVAPSDRGSHAVPAHPEIAYLSGNSIMVAPFIGGSDRTKERNVS